jgi:hypothetical protein
MTDSPLSTAALSYAHRGWRVVPLHSVTRGVCSCKKAGACPSAGKHPRINNWETMASADADAIREWWRRWPNANVGVAFGEGLIDIELDTKGGKRGPETLKALEKRLGALPPTHTWRSGGGGLHRLFTVSVPVRTGVEALGSGVDVLGEGRQAVAPPSLHASGKRYVVVNDVEPVPLPAAWVEELAMATDAEASGIDLLDRDHTATVAEAEALLAHVPADSYDVWLKVGMALRHQWQDTDHEQDALALWDRWSSKSPKYVGGDCDSRWTGFNNTGVAFATVRWLSKEHGGTSRVYETKAPEVVRAESKTAAKTLAKKIELAETLADAREAAREARGVELTADDAAEVCAALRKKAKLAGEPMSKAEAESCIAYDRRAWFLTKARALNWQDTLYFQTGAKAAILEVSDGVTAHGRDSFNGAFGHRMTSGLATVAGVGGKAKAVDEPWDVAVNLVDEDGAALLPRVVGWGYKPGAGRVFQSAGAVGLLANTWAPWGVGDPDMLWTEQEEADVNLWRNHFAWLIGEEDAKVLVQFLAWVVQRPNRRIRWCFTLIGPEGCGKSMIAHELMRAVVGPRNLSIVGPADLASPQYNGWANAGAFGCIDELHVDADSQREFAVVNALKPALTDNVLRVSDKYRAGITVDNATTWMATTNFVVPFRLSGDASRRWFFARSNMNTLAQVREALGGEVRRAAYFSALAKAAQRSSSALRGWLSSVSLDGFDANHAPSCGHMQLMQDTSADPVNGLIRRAIEEGTEYVNDKVVGVRFLLDRLAALQMEEGATDQRVTVRSVSRKLAEMGYRLACTNEDPWRKFGAERDQNRRTSWYVSQPIGNVGGTTTVRDLVAGGLLA